MNHSHRFFLSALLALPAHAATVTSSASGAWSNGSVWDDANPAAAGNDYRISSGFRVESPSAATVTFPGDSLTVEAGGILEIYRDIGGNTGQSITAEIPNLTVAGGTLRPRIGFATGNVILSSPLNFDGGGTIEVNTTAGTYSHTFSLNGAITGNGSVNVFRTAQGSGRAIAINGDASGFSGDWTFSSTAAESLNVTFGSGSGGWGSGSLQIGSWASLNLNANFTSTTAALVYGIDNTTLNLNADATIAGITIDGNPVAPGTYTATDLGGLGLGGNYGGSGTLTVIPEPAAILLGGLGLLGLLRRRR